MENRERPAPAAQPEKSTTPAAWAEDWSRPPQRMSAAVPLVFMALLLGGCVAWGFFFA